MWLPWAFVLNWPLDVGVPCSADVQGDSCQVGVSGCLSRVPRGVVWILLHHRFTRNSGTTSPSNVWCIKFQSKHSTVLLLCLLRNLMHQTLRTDSNPLLSSFFASHQSKIIFFLFLLSFYWHWLRDWLQNQIYFPAKNWWGGWAHGCQPSQTALPMISQVASYESWGFN